MSIDGCKPPDSSLTDKPPEVPMLDTSHPVNSDPFVAIPCSNDGSRLVVSWDNDVCKKRRLSSLERIDDVSEEDADESASEDLYQLGENNILPHINNDGTCSRCHVQMTSVSVRDELIECSCCFKKFHATCAPMVEEAKNNKLLIVPGKTLLTKFNQLMEKNGQYYGGEFGGFKCRSCVSLSTLREDRFRCDRLNMIESLLVEQKPLRTMLEQVIRRLDALESASSAKSTLPIVPPVGFQDPSESIATVPDTNLLTQSKSLCMPSSLGPWGNIPTCNMQVPSSTSGPRMLP